MTNLAGDALHLDGPVELARRGAWLGPLLLAGALAVWFGYELGLRALWSPDEGRYAEIAREMAASGDYLTPRLNGVKYFEKPPLVYWLTAGSIKLFGVNEWAARLWPALFALFGGMTVYFLGRRLYGARAGLIAAAVLALSPLYDFMGGVLTLDMPLTAWLTAAMAAFWLGVHAPPGARRRLWLYGGYAAVAAAVLTKGLVGIVIPAMIIAAWIAVTGEWRLLRQLHLPSGTLVFLAIAAPWHILVAHANPEFARFYFIHEHIDRYLTTAHQRYKPVWFFVPILLAGMFPWSTLLPQALGAARPRLWRERRRHADTWFLLLWAGVPFLFFSLSSSKLVPYVLPVLPPLALLLGRALARAWERSAPLTAAARWLLLLLGAVFAALLAGLPRLAPDSASVASAAAQLGGGLYAMAAALLLAGLLPYLGHRWGGPRTALALLGAGAALAVLTFDMTFSRLDVGRSVKPLAVALKPALQPGDEVMTYREYYQDLPVYLERRITIVDWTGELEFGASVEDTSAWMIDETAFRRRWAAPRTIYLLTSRANYAELSATPPGPMCQVGSTARVVAVVNRACDA